MKTGLKMQVKEGETVDNKICFGQSIALRRIRRHSQQNPPRNSFTRWVNDYGRLIFQAIIVWIFFSISSKNLLTIFLSSSFPLTHIESVMMFL